MITAEALNCAGSLGKSGAAVQLACEIPAHSDFWPALWQAIAALATLVAVGVALYQTRVASGAAKEANKTAAMANELLVQRHEDDRYRQASRVVAWMEIDSGTRMPRIYIENASDDAIYNVTVIDERLDGGKWELPVMRPRTKKDKGLVGNKGLLGKLGPDQLLSVHVSFEDSLGRVYERDPEKGGFLTDIGPCWT